MSPRVSLTKTTVNPSAEAELRYCVGGGTLASDDSPVLDDSEIRHRLISGSAAAFAFNRDGLGAAHG